MPKRLTKEEFIKKAKNIHGDKYDYSKVEYVNTHTKVCIICPIHGEFWQRPNDHLQGDGCKSCGLKKRSESKTLTTESFIKKSRVIHGDKYDYSKVEYKGSETKVCITCKEHGEFWQKPSVHLRGHGCQKCGITEISKKAMVYTLESFVKKAIEIHGNKYDYSKVEYVGSHDKVCIICPKHGEFWVTPTLHLRGVGCKKCYYDIVGDNQKKTTEEFIKDAKNIHGDKYDYSKVNYINAHTKVCIICHKHGEFWQTPNVHLTNHGCPYCKLSKLELEIKKLLDENNIMYEYQKRFRWLGRQSLDFYLPEYNVGIECQGRQHYIPSSFGSKTVSTEQFFKELLERDNRKKKLCLNNNINILYYTNYDKKIDNITFNNGSKLVEKIFNYDKVNIT